MGCTIHSSAPSSRQRRKGGKAYLPLLSSELATVHCMSHSLAAAMVQTPSIVGAAAVHLPELLPSLCFLNNFPSLFSPHPHSATVSCDLGVSFCQAQTSTLGLQFPLQDLAMRTASHHLFKHFVKKEVFMWAFNESLTRVKKFRRFQNLF